MRFEEAIKFGKATLDGTAYVEFNEEGVLVDNNGNEQYFNKEYLTSTDWEIYEEPKKTLFEKGVYTKSYKSENEAIIFSSTENKEALKKYFNWEDLETKRSGRHNNEIVIRNKVRRDTFGNEMLEKE